MARKIVRTAKSSAKSSKSKAAKRPVAKATKQADSRKPKGGVGAKKGSARPGSSGKFIAAKTGRIVKSSPAEPRLGRKRIRAIVREVVEEAAAKMLAG